MKETKKEKPTELTLKDLYITAKTPACESTVQSFVAKFGIKVGIHNPELKKWIKERHLEKDFQDNLPEYYAIIFEEWQPKINEIVWVAYPGIEAITKPHIGRVIFVGKNEIHINDGKHTKWYNINRIKPISERPFQVGDCYWDKAMITFGICGEDKSIEELNNDKNNRYKLIISPAIPEVE